MISKYPRPTSLSLFSTYSPVASRIGNAGRRIRGAASRYITGELHQKASEVLAGQYNYHWESGSGRALNSVGRKANRFATRKLRKRPGTIDVPVDRLLQGSQGGLSSHDFSHRIRDLSWGSKRIAESPHADLLRQAAARGDLSNGEIENSSYWKLAQMCVAATGSFFGAKTETELLEVCHNYISWALHGYGRSMPVHGTRLGVPIVVAPVIDSNFYSIIDGHHRAALLAVRDEPVATVGLTWLKTRTPLQTALQQMSWLQGEPNRLYQPIESPDIRENWVTVRQCTDRLKKMIDLLDDVGEISAERSYLDVACCYGWFVRAMEQEGFKAMGVERDSLCPGIGSAVYGLDESQIHVADAENWLLSQAGKKRWSVVSCFSLIHHFVRYGGYESARTLLQLLDAVTEKVLFIDSGEDHEISRTEILRGWNATEISRFIRENSTFTSVIDLGPDKDGVGPYEGHYGRHLFACVR